MTIDPPRGPCPGDNTLAELIGGASTLDAELPRHIAQCTACQELVAEALREGADEAPRYRIEDLVGTGGMGLVLRAFDVVLERPVALKILWGTDDRSVDAVLAEARTLARFAHPNIVTVHDAGVLEPQRAPFIAMELVEGPSLREWSTVRRPWRQVVEVFLGAAAGLAAAHQHEIVHADFKPANVLLGEDGRRVLVTDFGLARRHAIGSDEAPAGPTGGTPRYAAPELARQPPDARSDQFAFGVALHEALFGRHPFRVEDGCPARGCTDVPSAFERIVARCLERDPTRRYASMAAVIADMRTASRTRSSWAWVVGGAAALLVGGVVWSMAGEPCRDDADARVDRWRTELRPALADAIDPDAWSGVAPLADAWVETWRARAELACRSEDPTLHACVQERWATLDALVERVALDGDNQLRDAAALALAHLPDAEACRRPGAEAGSPEATAEEIATAASALARGRASLLLGDAEPAEDALREAIEIAESAELHGLQAEAHLVRAKLRWHAGAADAAFDEFSRASELAVRAGLPDLAAVATGSAAQYVAYYRRDAELARRWLQQARALASRGEDPLTDLNLDRAEAWILSAEGNDAAAAELMRTVVDRLDADHPLAQATNAVDLASMLGWAGDIEQGLVEVDRGIELRQRTLGASHPEVAQALESKATLLARADRFDEAAALLQQVVAAYGEDGARAVAVRISLASVLIDAGRIDEADAIVPRGTNDPALVSVVRQLDARIALARGHADEAWAILQSLLDDSAGAGRFSGRRLLGLQRDLGLTALARADHAEATRWLDRALAHEIAIDDTTLGELHFARARALAPEGACPPASHEAAQRAIEAWTHKHSPHALARMSEAQTWLAQCSNQR